MNYYTRAQQVLEANNRLSAVRMAHLSGLRGMGQAASAGLPAGSRLTYTAQFLVHYSTLTGTRDSLATIVQQLTSQLGNYAILVIGQTLGPEPITTDQRQIALTVTTQSDRNSQNDVKSILDGLLANLGQEQINSTIGTLVLGSSAPGTPPPPPQPPFDFGEWLRDNWAWVLAGAVTIFAADEIFSDL